MQKLLCLITQYSDLFLAKSVCRCVAVLKARHLSSACSQEPCQSYVEVRVSVLTQMLYTRSMVLTSTVHSCTVYPRLIDRTVSRGLRPLGR